jgi:hypothetical protein
MGHEGLRSGGSKRLRSKEKNRILLCSFVIFWLSASCIFSGCVRVAGTAGYWHTNEEGGAQTKQVGFDSTNLVSKDKDQGRITV